MKKILKFKLSGNFGYFKYPFTSPNKLKKTFNIPPRTTILGTLGSIIGLNGFQQFKDDMPEYYKKLNHIKMFISLNKLPQRQLIKYNSLNSFANNTSENPNVIIQEEILLNPEYEIGLLLDNEINEDKLILEYINNKQVCSNYHIYLGKNEFFANISEVEIFDENNFIFEKVKNVDKLKSIIPLNLLDTNIIYENLVLDTFSKNIIFKDKKLKTELCEIGFFIKDEEKRKPKFLEEVELCKIKENFYYLF